MLRPRSARLIAVAILALSATSCVKSRHPLSDPDRSQVDAKLVGSWTTRDDEGVVTMMVIGKHPSAGKNGIPRGLMLSARITLDKDGLAQNSVDPFFVSKIGDKTFINRVEADFAEMEKSGWNASRVKSYLLIKYETVGDAVDFTGHSPAGLAQLARDGLLKLDGEELMDSTEKLAKFFDSSKLEALFPTDTGVQGVFRQRWDRFHGN
jgi:hypothetical protein